MVAARSDGDMGLLRFTTAGGVDDGKSTLIGRLLYDTKSVFADQLEEVRSASRRLGETATNLALLTDGLRAEREQKITIDVAYRYFATRRRKFIIADTPGHVQYTRNMVTGASTAELAVVLIDARRGVLTQSKRHAFIASLLGIPHLIVAVNKMDLVDYSEEVYDRVRSDFARFARKLTVKDITYLPISALHGDNVVAWSRRMPWYRGGALLHRLETVSLGGRRNQIDFRFPVQHVFRPDEGFRGYAGSVASGRVAPGDEIVVLPSGQTTRVRAIHTPNGRMAAARPGDAVVLTTDDEIDISRGDMIVRRRNIPVVTNRFEAYLCWMGEEAMQPRRQYHLLHTTHWVRAVVERIEYRVDVNTLRREPTAVIELNDIGRVEITATRPLFFDSYRVNSATGSFVLVDPHTNVTVAAGMIRGRVRRLSAPRRRARPAVRRKSERVVWEGTNIPREEREERIGHKAFVLWFTGMSAAGKSTVARGVERALFERGVRTMLLDGDHLRHGLTGDLGFSDRDRTENIRRVGEVAGLFFEQGSAVLCTFVSPFRDDRDRVRALFPADRFFEVHVYAPLDVLRARDPKGLYRLEASGELELPGSRSAYEVPERPELELDTSAVSPGEAVEEVLDAIGFLIT
ncbi:MAG: sulfate adenylyltransferase subunit CysN [Gammaproteobacteria bacterium]|nr:sulfate adenylyltransferase subunit CysN [Gammaproteobacteria bacterium]